MPHFSLLDDGWLEASRSSTRQVQMNECTELNNTRIARRRFKEDRQIHPGQKPAVLFVIPYLQSAVKHRFLLKNGRTWFWNRSATALTCVPEYISKLFTIP